MRDELTLAGDHLDESGNPARTEQRGGCADRVHPLWVYAVPMAKTIQVRDVPDDVHRRLTRRAKEERRSLSELVRSEIVEIATRPTMTEMLDRLTGRPLVEVPESSADALASERRGT